MASASPISFEYFLVKWVFIHGECVRNFEVDCLRCFGGNSEDIRLNDNVDTYLRDADMDVFGKFISEKKTRMWVKVISNPIEKEGVMYQSCYLCMEGKSDEELEKLQDFLSGQKEYSWQRKKDFPWPRGIYYGETVKTYQDK